MSPNNRPRGRSLRSERRAARPPVRGRAELVDNDRVLVVDSAAPIEPAGGSG
jgi:hypothetical protein